MANLRAKKRLMYVVFACIFIFGGVEYAVILPTLWLYLSNVYKAPDYMLGLVLSAYSLAAMFSAPIIGRLSDRIGCSKQIFIVCAIFELAGSFLYFIEISQWLCVASRFVSGMGAASEAVAIAEVSRYTAEKERTAIISYLVAMRQIALLIGPGLNAFLRLACFKIGPFEVNKYTAPGAFMVIIWGLLILIVLVLYKEPKQLYMQEMEHTISAKHQHASAESVSVVDDGKNECAQRNSSSASVIHVEGRRESETSEHLDNNESGMTSHPAVCASDSYLDCVPANDVSYLKTPLDKDVPYLETPPVNDISYLETPPTTDISYFETPPVNDVSYLETPPANERVCESDLLQSGDETPFHFPPLSFHSCRQGDTASEAFRSTSVSKSSIIGFNPPTTEAHINGTPWPCQHDPIFDVSRKSSVENDSRIYSSLHMSSSLDLLISAERIINDSQYFKRQMDEDDKTGLIFDEDHFGLNADDFCSHPAQADNEKSPLLQRHQRRQRLSGSQGSLFRSYGANGAYIERSTSCLNDPISIEGKLGFFYNEYIRDEIIAIIYLLFCAMFSQMCVETMVLPLTQKYLDFDELENSILYCACGVEIIIGFVLVSKLSSRLSDRVMMMFGAVVIVSSNIWLICFLPNAPPKNRSHNIPIFAVAVFLDVLSLPFLIVCATSLYSKLTRKETQGLSQGLRRGIVGLGTVIAPMWGSSAVMKPYLLLGVLLGLQGLSLILCAISYKRFKVPEAPALISTVTPSPALRSGSQARSSISPTLPPSTSEAYTRNAQRRLLPVHSTSYGSIQVSIAGSSYRSMETSGERQPFFSRPVV